MTRALAVLSFIIIILAGCSSGERIPDDVLPPHRMEAVLWDMMRADQFLADYVFSRDTTKDKDKESIRIYSQVFRLHRIDKEEFSRSFAYYRSHPGQLQPLMDSISKMSVAAPTAPVLPDTTRKTVLPADTTRQAGSDTPQVKPRVVPRRVMGDTTRPFFKRPKNG
jgi:Domain of unknown function (DUF4296)